MLKMQIINTVKIEPLNEEYIKQLIIADIKKQDPRVHVNGIDFEVRRSPQRIEAVVDAQYGEPAPQVAGDADKQQELPVEEPVEEVATETNDSPFVPDEEDEPVEEKATTTVADIFGS